MNCNSCTGTECLRQVQEKGKRKVRVSSTESFKCLLSYLSQGAGSDPVAKLLDRLESGIKSACSAKFGVDLHPNAFNNVRGYWFEGIASFWLWSCWNWDPDTFNRRPYYILRLPDAKVFRLEKLFASTEAGFLTNLREQLGERDVALETSNPDFIVVTLEIGANAESGTEKSYPAPGGFKPEIGTFERFRDVYGVFEGKCKYTDIVCAIGLKDSLKPDRRLQLVYEGNIFKALMLHLQTRFWDYNFVIPPFYAIANGEKEPTEADLTSLRTATTSTLADVRLRPERAVDEVFYADHVAAIGNVFARIRKKLGLGGES